MYAPGLLPEGKKLDLQAQQGAVSIYLDLRPRAAVLLGTCCDARRLRIQIRSHTKLQSLLLLCQVSDYDILHVVGSRSPLKQNRPADFRNL